MRIFSITLLLCLCSFLASAQSVTINNGNSIALCVNDSVLLSTTASVVNSYAWKNLDSIKAAIMGSKAFSSLDCRNFLPNPLKVYGSQ